MARFLSVKHERGVGRNIQKYIFIYIFILFCIRVKATLVHGAFRLVVRCSFVFCKQQMLLAKISHVIYFSQSQLLLAKTNEDRTTSRDCELVAGIFGSRA